MAGISRLTRSWARKRCSPSWEETRCTTNISSLSYTKVGHDALLIASSFSLSYLRISLAPAYELWFKQILFEVDSVRDLFLGKETISEHFGAAASEMARTGAVASSAPSLTSAMAAASLQLHGESAAMLDERRMLEIKRMGRVVMILKVRFRCILRTATAHHHLFPP